MVKLHRPRFGPWQLLVPVVALLAGLLGATTAHTARGTDLRSAGPTNIADLIRQAEGKVGTDDNLVKQLQHNVADSTNKLAQSDQTVAAINSAAAPLRVPAGLVAMTGPGLTLTLDDAHPAVEPTDPDEANAIVVHQSDMQAAVNALWAGGAEAIMVMDQRLVQTSAIRCVGNTLLLNGRVYSPPFSIAAIGPAGSMRAALNRSAGLRQYRKDADTYGLGYDLNGEGKISVPAYDAPIGLSYAVAGG
ncbi:MAG: DUF881 domain-containing protein [Actinomycetota bacterium]|nr:DUF881 domain-containing protein [Actinomycetota bacterium]MDQ2955384.1 DUF881 domain-containing protein [Actinomycetota bacterium]